MTEFISKMKVQLDPILCSVETKMDAGFITLRKKKKIVSLICVIGRS